MPELAVQLLSKKRYELYGLLDQPKKMVIREITEQRNVRVHFRLQIDTKLRHLAERSDFFDVCRIELQRLNQL